MDKRIRSALFSGTVSGTGLAAFLWMIEEITNSRVFTLLLNVDFIPVIGSIDWPVVIEFLFHLIISWIIAFLYSLYLERERRSNAQKWTAVFLLSLGAGLSYFPLSVMAIKPVPASDSMEAIIYWFLGHFLYAVLLKKAADS